MLAYWFYKKQELITLNDHLGSPPVYLVKSVLLIGLVFCVAVFSFFYSSSIVSLNCNMSKVVYAPSFIPHLHSSVVRIPIVGFMILVGAKLVVWALKHTPHSEGRHCRHRMIVGFTTTYATSAYHH
jgi:hypothetical protein